MVWWINSHGKIQWTHFQLWFFGIGNELILRTILCKFFKKKTEDITKRAIAWKILKNLQHFYYYFFCKILMISLSLLAYVYLRCIRAHLAYNFAAPFKFAIALFRRCYRVRVVASSTAQRVAAFWAVGASSENVWTIILKLFDATLFKFNNMTIVSVIKLMIEHSILEKCVPFIWKCIFFF